MFCDRVAASKIYQGEAYTDAHPLSYYLRGNARAKMHADTADLLEDWLRRLELDGERATFSYLRGISNRSEYGNEKTKDTDV
jgi:hypothetical protein